MSAQVDRVLRQVERKGFGSREELAQLVEAGVPAYHLLADRLGVTPKEVGRLAEAQELKPADVRAVAH